MKINVKNVIKENKNEIILVGSVFGFAGAAYGAYKAGTKAAQVQEEWAEKNGMLVSEMTKLDKAQALIKPLFPSAVLFTGSCVGLFAAHKGYKKFGLAAIASSKMANDALKDAKETIAKLDAKQVAAAKKKAEKVLSDDDLDKKKKNAKIKKDNNKVKEDKTIIINNEDGQLCVDALSGQQFKASKDEIDKAINQLNKNLLNDYYISFNEYLTAMGLETSSLGDEIGWSMNDSKILEVDYDAVMVDGKAALSVNITPTPMAGYNKIA